MKNLLSTLGTSVKLFGLIVISGEITYNLLTYHLVENQISNAEKEGKECAIDYCKSVLRNSYEDSRIERLFNGGDDAAREYLEKIELNK